MNNRIGVFKMATAFIGSILGAGFVSGQELWLYFGSYGKKGLLGLLLAVCILSLSNMAVLWIASKTGDSSIDTILFSSKGSPLAREGTGILFVFFYFCIAVVMIAGIASLISQLPGIPVSLGGFLAAALIMGVTYFGLRGMTTVFSISIPVLVSTAILISVLRLYTAGLSSVQFSDSVSNPLLGSFLSSAINYSACNIFASTGIIAPLAPFLSGRRSAVAGSFCGGVFLFLIALFLLLALSTSPESVLTDLPMMDLSRRMGNVFSLVYGILLFLGMFGSGVSTMVAVDTYLMTRYPLLAPKRILLLFVLGACGYLLSLCGFSDLVGIVYPVMGYVGVLSILLLIVRVIRLKLRDVNGVKENRPR